MPNFTRVKVTKPDVAKGQLDTAIFLWFLDKDVASIHTLAAAALELLHALRKGEPAVMFETIKDDRGLHDKAKRAQNFFKHADKDKNHVLIFPPELNELTMYDAIMCFESTYGFRSPLMRAFGFHFALRWKDKFIEFPFENLPEALAERLSDLASGSSRGEFLDACIQFFEEERIALG